MFAQDMTDDTFGICFMINFNVIDLAAAAAIAPRADVEALLFRSLSFPSLHAVTPLAMIHKHWICERIQVSKVLSLSITQPSVWQ